MYNIVSEDWLRRNNFIRSTVDANLTQTEVLHDQRECGRGTGGSEHKTSSDGLVLCFSLTTYSYKVYDGVDMILKIFGLIILIGVILPLCLVLLISLCSDWSSKEVNK